MDMKVFVVNKTEDTTDGKVDVRVESDCGNCIKGDVCGIRADIEKYQDSLRENAYEAFKNLTPDARKHFTVRITCDCYREEPQIWPDITWTGTGPVVTKTGTGNPPPEFGTVSCRYSARSNGACVLKEDPKPDFVPPSAIKTDGGQTK
jgi:hypothetical protein